MMRMLMMIIMMMQYYSAIPKCQEILIISLKANSNKVACLFPPDGRCQMFISFPKQMT